MSLDHSPVRHAAADGTGAVTIAAVEAFAYRVPISVPVRSSFGMMRNRPAVFVRVVDEDGAEGFGEVWCNFPPVGAEHRARLVRETVGPLLIGKRNDPARLFAETSRALEVLAIQCGEPGTIAQAIAGVDIALWDLAARRAGQPLHRFIGGGEAASVPAYASGLGPDAPEQAAAACRKAGHRTFKLKVGFGRERDLANLARMRETLGDAPIAIDANQAWDTDMAIAMGRDCAAFGPIWLEEPLRADASNADWLKVARSQPVALAGGENLRGAEAYADAIATGALAVIQPDIGKWGGFTGCLAVARRAIAEGRRYCPHWLGGGVGLIASLHLLAAAGGDGLLEVDANPNLLREEVAGDLLAVADGRIALPRGPGLGLVPDLRSLQPYLTDPR